MDQVEGMGEKDMDQMSDWADLILTRFCPFAISLEQFPEILNECVFFFFAKIIFSILFCWGDFH